MTQISDTREPSHRLSGRVALVTGASRGIGRATAIALAREGADVVVNCCSSAREAREVCDEIESMGRRAIPILADVSIAAEVEDLAARSRQLGAITILVNNAGIARQQGIDEASERDWDAVIDANLKSVFLVTQAILPVMRAARWGRIISVSSTAAQVGGAVGAHYAASKAGILGLTHFYASRLAGEGITANAVAPALVETDMVKGLAFDASRIPVGRLGKVEEVAEAIVMLAHNGYMTGQTINLNGGIYPT